MSFVTSLLKCVKSKLVKQTEVENIAITKEEISLPSEKIDEVIQTTRQVQISSIDDFKFDGEGLPIIENLSGNDIHTITKRNFAPTKLYTEPGFLPWSEQLRYKNEPQIAPIAPVVHNTSNQIEHVNTNSVPLHTPNPSGMMGVYNGYPLLIHAHTGVTVIAINNRGDIEININDLIPVYDGTNTVLYNGKILEVLDCNEYTRGKIKEVQGEIYYI